MAEDTADRARKRQARGEQRIEALLDAAAEVFAAQGYGKASTNAIAAAAGASPGTLYQFFKNKQAIAEALMDRYVAGLRSAMGEAFSTDATGLPLSALLDQILDPIIAFDRAHPGFHALLADPGVTPELAGAKRPAQMFMFENLDRLFAARAPEVPAAQRLMSVQVAVHMFRGMLPLVVAATDAELPEVAAEVKRALSAYLAPVLG